MKLKNFLITVEDMERSKAFYRELFGLTVVRDFGENVIFTEGLVLQERKTWEGFLEKQVSYQGHDAELYFEENDLEGFLEKLESCSFEIQYINTLMKHSWGQRVVRFYDPDMHVIEVGERIGI